MKTLSWITQRLCLLEEVHTGRCAAVDDTDPTVSNAQLERGCRSTLHSSQRDVAYALSLLRRDVIREDFRFGKMPSGNDE